MPSSKEATRWGLAKETNRLTAESAPSAWISVEKSSNIDHKLEHLQDNGLRGVKANFAPLPGMLVTGGKVSSLLRVSSIGYFLNMLLGAPVTTEVEAGAAYKHSFGLSSSIQPPTYTFFIDRGMNVKKYNGVANKKMTLKASANGLISHESELIGLNEADGSIGTPSYANEGNPLSFMHAAVKVGGVASADIKDWTLNIDNGLFAKRVLSASQVAADVLASAELKVDGNFTIYFESATEREKFLAGISNSLEFLVEGGLAGTTAKETVDITLPNIFYKGYAYGEVDNLLAATVSFEAALDLSTSKMITADVINKIATI